MFQACRWIFIGWISNYQSGQVSAGIDASVEYVTLAQDMKKYDKQHARESSIGLGYRVPLVIASPWSRGGAVCSQVFDHTSIIQFIEKFVSTKFNKKLEEPNITKWRRTVCGDLTSVFKPYNGEQIKPLSFVAKDDFLESVHKAKFKKDPSGYRVLTDTEIAAINKRKPGTDAMPVQEKGTRPACAIPYELYADGHLDADKKTVGITFTAGKDVFGEAAAGSPFYVYANTGTDLKVRTYATAAGDTITDSWALDEFSNQQYQLSLYGPNGFFREFTGSNNDPLLNIALKYTRDKKDTSKLTGAVEFVISNAGENNVPTLEIVDNSYKTGIHTVTPGAMGIPKDHITVTMNLAKSAGWYDFTVRVKGRKGFEKRYAGHVETGKASTTDPLMGGVV